MEFVKRYAAKLKRECQDGRLLTKSVATGLIGGLWPIPGTTTILVTVLCQILGTCAPVALAVNYIATPLEIMMIVPFALAGSFVLSVDAPPFTAEGIISTYKESGFAALFQTYGTALGMSVVGWALFSIVLYGIVLVALIFKRQESKADPSHPHSK